MFTAVSVVRLIMESWVGGGKVRPLHIRPLFGLLSVPRSHRLPFYARPLRWARAPGLNYGIDFVGGTLIEICTEQPAELEALRSALNGLNLGEIALQEAGSPQQVLVRMERQPGDDEAQLAATERVKTTLVDLAPGASIERVDVVGPR